MITMNLPPPSDENLERIYNDLDKNKDSKISFSELMPLIKRLFISEGFKHISREDLEKIKKLEF